MTDTSIEALRQTRKALQKILNEPNETLSDGKALREIIRYAKQAATVIDAALVAAANAAPAVTETTGRDWAEDSAHENGNYQCQCAVCGNAFRGHKRRMVCKSCAAPAVSQQPEDWRAMLYAPIDGTEIELLIFHANRLLPGLSDPWNWEAFVRAKWINHNGGGWTWEGMCGTPMGWRPIAAPGQADGGGHGKEE